MEKITKSLVSSWIPIRDKDTYKGKLGRVLCVGGNKKMGGAILLASSAALNAGAGLLTVASAEENLHALHARTPECMFISMYDSKMLAELIPTMDIIIVGPGLGRDTHSLKVLKTVYQHVTQDQYLLIDGDAIFLHVKNKLKKPNAYIIFTPHLGEWQTLSGLNPQEESVEKNKEIHQQLEATIVLKKARTQVYYQENVWENTTGNPSMATGGMGDTLVGMIAGLLGQYKNPEKAIVSAVYLHSYIGDQLAKKHYVTLPSHIITEISKTMKEFTSEDYQSNRSTFKPII